MGINELPADVRQDIIRRVAKGHGELLTIEYTDAEEYIPETSDGRTTGVLPEVAFRKVDKKVEVYVGKLTLGQTGTIVSILGRLFVDGLDIKQAAGRKDNLTFVNALNPRTLGVLLRTIVGLPRAWVEENYELGWAVDVLRLFFQYNDFFGLIQKVQRLTERYGLTESRIKELASGQTAES